jgi:trigger factor
MQVSLETLSGLERKITVSVPNATILEQVNTRLRDLVKKAHIDGFRQGKAPLSVIKKRFEQSVLQEVAEDTIKNTLFKALEEQDLTPAGMPTIDSHDYALDKDMTYSAIIEIFPKIDIKELDGVDIELSTAEVSDHDVDVMIEKLRQENKVWVPVTRAARSGDLLTFDFEGFLDGVAFDGGQANDFSLEIGSARMIPGFEDKLIGAELDKPFEFTIQFPEDYGSADLAGKEATFKILVKSIQEPALPELNDDFALKFDIKEGGLEALKRDIRANMDRELALRLERLNKETVFDHFAKANPIEVPKSLVNDEIENMKHDMYHRVYGNEHHDNETIPDFPRELFEAGALGRVRLGLLLSTYVDTHKIKPEESHIEAKLDQLTSAYEDTEEAKAWYRRTQRQMDVVHNMVLEELTMNQISKVAKIIMKTISYDEVMNPMPKENTEVKTTEQNTQGD